MSEKQDTEAKAAEPNTGSEAPQVVEVKTAASASGGAAASSDGTGTGTGVSPVEAKASLEGDLQRRSIWYTSLQALKYVNGLSKDDDLRVRDSDRTTAIMLLAGSVVSFVSLFVPAMLPMRLPLLVGCDVLVGVIIALYVAHRFGVINTMTPRQAVLSWQLIVGGSFLGVFITLNVAIIVFYLLITGTINITSR